MKQLILGGARSGKSRLAQERAEASGNSVSTGKFRDSRISSMTSPTAPVTPTTATLTGFTAQISNSFVTMVNLPSAGLNLQSRQHRVAHFTCAQDVVW